MVQVGPVEAMQKVAGNTMLFEHHGDGLFCVVGWVALATAFSVGCEGVFELIGEAEVVDYQSSRLITEHTIHSRYGLHKAVALHRLVRIHGVEAWRIETGQPHVPHYHDTEGVFGILEPVCQFAAFILVAYVWLPVWAILRATRHHHLY